MNASKLCFIDVETTGIDRSSENLLSPVKIHVEKFSSEHINFWLEMYKDETVKRQMYAAPTHSQQAFIEYLNLSPRTVFTVFMDNCPIGGFTITKEKDKMGTFGIVIHPDFRGKGISKEIMKELEIKARDLGFLTLRGDVYSDNYACIKALEKSGFRHLIWFEKNLTTEQGAALNSHSPGA